MMFRLVFAPLFFLSFFTLPLALHAEEPGDNPDEIKVCEFGRPEIDAKGPGSSLKIERVKDATIHGAPIPTFSMAFEDPASDNEQFETYTPEPQALSINLTAEQAKNYKAYGTPLATVIVPADWKPLVGSIGVNASFRIIFAPDATGQTYLLLESDGFCAGCSITASDLYFGNSTADNPMLDPTFNCLKPPFVHTARLNDKQAAYRIDADKGNPVEGVAYYNTEDNISFWNVQVSMPKEQHAIATILLNQFVAHKKGKNTGKQKK